MNRIIPAVQPEDDLHFKKFGLKKDEIMQWEDGLRTDCKPGTYEWWYFDTHLNDGTIIVIVFYTKSAIAPNGPLDPHATFEITTPDGTTHMETFRVPIGQSHFEKSFCNVKIGNCYFSGDLKNYKIHFENDKVNADITLTGTVPSWRPRCGTILFGENDEYNFSWLPSVPEGSVKADVKWQGRTTHYEGYGYHDHNWGNTSMITLMNHWYWGRAKIGPYTVLTSWITAEKKYGYKDFDIFMVAKDGKILSEGHNAKIQFSPSKLNIDKDTGKPVHDKLLYTYTDDLGNEYRVTYDKENFISKTKFVDTLAPLKKFLAKIAGMNGAYMRFSGIAHIESLKKGKFLEQYSAPAVWELMYFGKNMINVSAYEQAANKNPSL